MVTALHQPMEPASSRSPAIGRPDSEIISANWAPQPLGELFEITAGGDLRKEDFSPIEDNNFRYPIYANAIQNRGLYGFSSSQDYSGNKITVTARGGIGHAEYRERPFCAIGRLLVLSPKKDLNLRLVTEYINSYVLFAVESTGVPQLTAPQISKYCVSIPDSREEQEAIAEALSDADAVIESLETLIAKKRAIKQGTMQVLLAPKNGWIEHRLGDSAQLKARIGWQGLTTAEYLKSGNYQLVTGTDFNGGFIDWSNCCFVERRRYDQDSYIQLREGDVLVTKDGTIGKIAYIDDLPLPATLNSGVFVVRPIENSFRPRFLYYLLMSRAFDEFLSKLSAGSTINHLYQKDFVDFVFRVPPTNEEQDEISSALMDMDNNIKTLEARLVKVRQIKKGMMQELLTGRVRLV